MTPTIKLTRRGFAGVAAGLLAAPAVANRAFAAASGAWPDRPVRMVVPFGAGGAIDTLARAFGQRFPEFANGQPLVIENRSGAGGMVAGAFVTTQPADGYTLMMADIGANALGKVLNPRITYDPMTGFTPLMHLVNLHAVLAASPALRPQSVAEILEEARRRPDGLVYSSAGVGNGSHLFMALLERQARVKMVHVPYRSGSETVTAVMRGDAQLCFPTLSSALSMIRGGQLRPVALGAGPSPILPQSPLMRDTLPGFDVAIWYGLAAPPGMEDALADRVNAVFGQIAALPEIRRAVEETQAGSIVGGSRQEFAAFIQREYERWTPVIREGGISLE
ncbi:Bug family tripartite tricarboxylate transporter substrate binding protein [Teichococcus vastitatis]|uniref:Tripartite tricarboxylate transporter substrate binding protein n=1 Tax=Teichococcus vastitatis TaxID=2307076 RepID=A0ABS9W7W2_9PROT|nr:tripartite tricarboxylate transporter substrate binding protein [Pseudoroseomonas vastitatis]MCI0755308.1 tripartite tricarboxylate transporter substrate binding protein [Pseudoroseomonas vastitatis]